MQEQTATLLEKERIRQDALRRRATIQETARIAASMDIVAYLEELDIEPGQVVAGFWPIRDEIDPRPLMNAIRLRGHRLALPIVAHPTLLFRELLPDAALVKAGFGTMGPGPDVPEIRPDVLLMPLAAYDQRGERIGYGKGHYDRAIAALEEKGPVKRIGLAFSLQEVPEVPTEAYDKRLHQILTEQGVMRFEER
ncbi:MAG: 5-formyltetrahydrofolate cyclo-ligase [Stappiaceae bacterium]